jgi:hypothetical protein
MSHKERRTYMLGVVVQPAEGVWHAYCPTLDRLQLRELGRRQLGPVARDADDNAAEDFHPPGAVPPGALVKKRIASLTAPGSTRSARPVMAAGSRPRATYAEASFGRSRHE